jgi:carotenoid cleavage dioxygenase
MFEPISYTYPMDGDGMVHAVYFDNGRARYKNRYVRTRGLEVELRAGRAVYGGLLRPVEVDPAIAGPDGEPGPYKSGTFISVLHHGGHLLALGEGQPAYEMTLELDTIGEWQVGSGPVIELGAHNRHHPVTGDLFALAYTPFEPVVYIHHIDRSGKLKRTFPVQLAAPSMIHDFVLTETRIVLLVGPAVFDMQAAAEGKPFLQWQPQHGTRIGVIALDGSSATWIEAEPYFVYHLANGFERAGQIVLDYVRHESLRLGPGSAKGGPPRLRRLVIDPVAGRVEDTALTDFLVEFPRINDRFEAMPSRFVYLPTLSDTLKIEKPPSATFNVMVKVDSETGAQTRRDLGNRIAGEAVFIPRKDGTAEDDGYLAVYTYDPEAETSDLLLLDAARIDAKPVAVIRMPQRVPQGLHGTWIAR